jgi:hypothetical protein
MSGDIKDDPIFEVIEAHRRADASFMEAMRAQHRRHDDKGSDMVDALENASSEATIRLLSTTPTTLPGNNCVTALRVGMRSRWQSNS